MKVLLINSNTKRLPWPVPPLGLCYVAASLDRAGHRVRFLDLTFADDVPRDVTSAVRDFDPDVIGISVRNIDNNSWRETAFYPARIRSDVVRVCRLHSKALIVLGGAAVGINPRELLDYFGVDYVVQGDGEASFLELLAAHEVRADVTHVKGLVFRREGSVVDQGYHRTEDLDALPLPEVYRWVDVRAYERLNGSIGVQAKRGCSLRCSYCAYPSIEGSVYRLRSPRGIADEVEKIVRECNPSIIEFVDSVFNVPMNHAVELCDELARRRVRSMFRAMSISPMQTSWELFDKMKRAGFADFDINVESASAVTLKSLGKPYSKDAVVETARLLRRTGLPAMWFFLFGAPGETEDTIVENFRFIDEHVPANHLCVIAAGLRINSGTPLAARAIGQGLLRSDHDFLTPTFYEHPSLPRQRLLELVEGHVARRPHCMFLKESSYRPDWMIKGAKSLYKLLGIKKPLWQLEIALRRASHCVRSAWTMGRSAGSIGQPRGVR